MGEVLGIWISTETGGDNQPLETVLAVAGEGLVGDRYRRSGKPDQEITLIESEQLDWFQQEHGMTFPPAQTRRNILTRDIRLNELVGRRILIGGAVIEGMRLCEPCKTLQERTGLPVLPAMINRGGLNCRIIQGGEIRIGDAIDQIRENAKD
ncbi:MAG: MOSC domain-containing protein [Phycisphaerales bacterium]|nr:MOSC domain-containing protein [Phycisphaerales bacterium]